MRHLIVTRELPPGAYTAGGIGTYVANIGRLLADAGETVHLVGERWRGAPDERLSDPTGRLVTHRVSVTEPLARGRGTTEEFSLLLSSPFPPQAWGWNASLLVEELVESEQIDVIEAQEWEAPLYYFLLRRALGMGPAREPPVIIQLHSPSEFIWRANKWSIARPDFLITRRQEEFCIRAADAVLCPSRYLARQAEERYGLAENSVTVIPCPIGVFPVVARTEEGPASGPVVYVGRLEPRKGLIEFVEAAVRVSEEFPGVDYDFIGKDLPYRDGLSVQKYAERLIPRNLRQRFHFRGAVGRLGVAEALAGASFAVVPSRWENCPNTCIEAMASGVPVLASPNGGMVEMIEDGVSGWIAASQDPPALAAALRRALATSPQQRAAMGRAAVDAIQSLCGRDVVVEAHLRYRAAVAERGVVRSHRLTNDPGTGERDPGSLRSIRSHGPRSPLPDQALAIALDGFQVEQPALNVAAAVLRDHPDIGVISGWIAGSPEFSSSGPPVFPYQWLVNDANGVVFFRRQALESIADVEQDVRDDQSMWDLVNAVLASGWKSVALPMIVGRLPAANHRRRGQPAVEQHAEPAGRLRQFRERYPELFERDHELRALLLDIGTTAADQLQRTWRSQLQYAGFDRWRNLAPGELWQLSLRETMALASAAARNPQRTLAWLRSHVPAVLGTRQSGRG
jgi:glycosyltransferase involved in cell wall biosynthesis